MNKVDAYIREEKFVVEGEQRENDKHKMSTSNSPNSKPSQNEAK